MTKYIKKGTTEFEKFNETYKKLPVIEIFNTEIKN